MTLKQTVRHCIEKTGCSGSSDYELQDNPTNENAVVLHASKGFLTKDFTRELRHRLIFVEASAALHEGYAMTYFLHYLEPEEDTFMDNLANPVSTDDDISATQSDKNHDTLEPAGFEFTLESGMQYINGYRRHTPDLEENREPLLAAEDIIQLIENRIEAIENHLDEYDAEESPEEDWVVGRKAQIRELENLKSSLEVED